MQRLLAPREAANILGISYPTLKQWIYHDKLKTVKTPGGHHRVPESEIDRLIPKKLDRGDITQRRGNFRKVSGRNQLIGRVVAIKFGGCWPKSLSPSANSTSPPSSPPTPPRKCASKSANVLRH